MNTNEDHAPSKRAEAARAMLEDLAAELYWEGRPIVTRETLDNDSASLRTLTALIDDLIIARIEQALGARTNLDTFLDALRAARGE